MFYRDTWAEVNLDAFQHNVRYLQEKINGKALFAVIKANAYGHGDGMIAKEAIRLGCPVLCVSSLDEAISLRNQGIDSDVFILGFTNPHTIETVLRYNVITTVPSLEWMKHIVKYSVEGLRLHIKVNTGMNRLGVNTLAEIKEILALAEANGCLVEGIFTHFRSSGWNVQGTQDQYDLFKSLVKSSGFSFKWIHCANSDAILSFDDSFCNAARAGIALFGLSDIVHENKHLQEVIRLYSRVSLIRSLKQGERVGYDETYTAQNDESIAVIPLGYADGFSRSNQNHYCHIGVKPALIVGKICMDQLMIRCDESVKMGDIVEFIGEHRSIADIESETGITPCETMTALSDRIPRVYIKDNKVIGDINPRINRTDFIKD